MGYSEAAMAGVRDNGRAWRGSIQTNGAFGGLWDAHERRDVEGVCESMRRAAKPFRKAMLRIRPDESEWAFSDAEAIAFFEHESPAYEYENGEAHCFAENADYHLNVLYDWADYHRYLVK